MPRSALKQIIDAHAGKPDELLMVAEELMDCFGAIPTTAPTLIQQKLGLTATEVQSILSFYDYPINDAPIKCRVEVCRAISCHLKSADAVLRHLCEAMNTQPGQIKEDSRLLITNVDCLSDCERAPAVHVNKESVATTDLAMLVRRIQEALA